MPNLYPVIVIPLLLLAGPAWAQDRPDAAGSLGDFTVGDRISPPEIVVAAGVSQYDRNIGQDVSILDRATIEQRQTLVVSDLLATLPGISVTRNGGLGGFTGVRLRGAEGEQTLVLIDGVRVNDPSSPGGGFDFANLLAGSIDRIEILRGANSVPWGSQAIGGVVNITTMQPRDALTARGSAEYGAFDTVAVNAGLADRVGPVAGVLTGGYLRSSGISAAANGTEADGYRQAGASGRVTIDLARGIGLDLRGYYAHSRVEQDGYPAPAYVLADDGEYAVTQEIYGYAGIHADLGWRFKNRLGFSIADINRDNYDPAFGTAPAFLARGRSERYEYQGDFKPLDPLRLVVGAEHENSRLFDGATRYATGVTSFYGEAVLTPVNRLTLTAGARHDQHRDYGGHWSVGANGVLGFGERTTVRASYAEGFKAPTLYQLFAPYYGTLTLRPETARSYDLGLAQSIAGNSVTLGATWFHRDTRHQIDFDLASSTYRNIDAARAEGLEFVAEARPIRGLQVSASYTHLKAENRSAGADSGKDLQRRPRDTGSISIDYRIERGMSFGGTLLVAGDSFDDPGNTVRLKGYALAGLRAEAPVTARLSIYGRVENLLDRRYQTVAGYGEPGRAAYFGVRAKLD